MSNALELSRGSSPRQFAQRFLAQPRDVQIVALEQLAAAAPAIDRARAYTARLERALEAKDIR
jgi:hypothetical protein